MEKGTNMHANPSFEALSSTFVGQSTPGIKRTRAKRDRYFLVESRTLWHRLRKLEVWMTQAKVSRIADARVLADALRKDSWFPALGPEYRVRRTDELRTEF